MTMMFFFKGRFNSAVTPTPTPSSGGADHGQSSGKRPLYDFFSNKRIDVPYYEETEEIEAPEQLEAEEPDTEVPEKVVKRKRVRKSVQIPVAPELNIQEFFNKKEGPIKDYLAALEQQKMDEEQKKAVAQILFREFQRQKVMLEKEIDDEETIVMSIMAMLNKGL